MKFIIVNILLFSFSISGAFKNVQVLEIESRSEMKNYMKSITKDIGSKCSYCHNMDDKSIDTPMKEVGREMIKLTQYLNNLLNNHSQDTTKYKTYVTCWTCHNGKIEPAHKRPEEN